MEADSAKAAMDIVTQGANFDLAILDFHMPEIDGWELAGQLREHPATESTSIIMLSSLGEHRSRPEVAERFSAYVNKPIKPSQLLDVLVSVMAEKPSRIQTEVKGKKFSFDSRMGINNPLDILLVEDNLVNQKVAAKLLGKFGYQVDIANNGVEALSKLEERDYQVLFMDIQMPEMDGEEATKRIRQNGAGEEQPWIIAMTAHALVGDREHFLGNGMDDYISKPLDVAELHQVLERIPVKEGGCGDR
jgi:CheY-like chemotaxis protein